MARPKIQPREHERPFEFDELFFSTTDQKGIILSGNDVFARVAGYDSVAELVGQPHNIIRHPDMPRAVFKLLWDTLKAGEPFAGYVKNMATDGGYYWVMALAMPVDDGYLSVRFKPSGPYFALVKEVYSEMLRIEQEAQRRADSWRAGMENAEAYLCGLLAQHGFADYGEFMRAALISELDSRRAKFTPRDHGKASLQGIASQHGIVKTLHTCELIEQQLDGLFALTVKFLQLIQQLDTKAAFLRGLAHKFHFVSLNGIVSSEHLGPAGMALSVVTQNLSTLAKESQHVIDQMTDPATVTSPLRRTAYAVSTAKLRVEMAVFFARSLWQAQALGGAEGGCLTQAQRDMDLLIHSLTQSLVGLLETLPQAQASIATRINLNGKLTEILQSLAVIRVAGKVQAVHVPGAEYFQEFFAEIKEQLHVANHELLELEKGIPYLQAHLPRFKQAGSAVQQSFGLFQ